MSNTQNKLTPVASLFNARH